MTRVEDTSPLPGFGTYTVVSVRNTGNQYGRKTLVRYRDTDGHEIEACYTRYQGEPIPMSKNPDWELAEKVYSYKRLRDPAVVQDFAGVGIEPDSPVAQSALQLAFRGEVLDALELAAPRIVKDATGEVLKRIGMGTRQAEAVEVLQKPGEDPEETGL